MYNTIQSIQGTQIPSGTVVCIVYILYIIVSNVPITEAAIYIIYNIISSPMNVERSKREQSYLRLKTFSAGFFKSYCIMHSHTGCNKTNILISKSFKVKSLNLKIIFIRRRYLLPICLKFFNVQFLKYNTTDKQSIF